MTAALHHAGTAASLAALTIWTCSPSPTPPSITLEASDYRYQMPSTVSAGVIRLQLHNAGAQMHEALLVRFNDPRGTAAKYVDSVRAHVLFPSFATDVGGAGLALPGDSSVTWLRLTPGRYAVVCWVHDHLSRGMAHDLLVVPNVAPPTPPPVATRELTLTNYAFTLSAPLTPGAHLLHVKNMGTEPHEADIFRLDDTARAEDYIAWLKGGEIGLPPVTPVGGLGDLAPGEEAWISLHLPPGRYLIFCQVKTTAGARPHYELGMMQQFEIPDDSRARS